MNPYDNIRAAHLALSALADVLEEGPITDDQIKELADHCVLLASECATMAHLLAQKQAHSDRQSQAIAALQRQAAESWRMIRLLSEAVFGPPEGDT